VTRGAPQRADDGVQLLDLAIRPARDAVLAAPLLQNSHAQPELYRRRRSFIRFLVFSFSFVIRVFGARGSGSVRSGQCRRSVERRKKAKKTNAGENPAKEID
jgi:hypothetical protein